MRIDEVKKLVSMLYDMELNNYMMSCCIKNLTETMSGLKKEKIISEPIYTVTPFQDKEIKVGEIIKTCAMIGFFLGAVPGLITGCEDGDGSGGLDVIANHLKYKIRKIMITLSKNTMKIVEKKKNAWKMRQNYITNFR